MTVVLFDKQYSYKKLYITLYNRSIFLKRLKLDKFHFPYNRPSSNIYFDTYIAGLASIGNNVEK